MPRSRRTADKNAAELERPRKKLKRQAVDPIPKWEKPRQFATEKRTTASLPVIQQDGKVHRLNVKRPNFIVKAEKKKLPSLKSQSKGDQSEATSDKQDSKNGIAKAADGKRRKRVRKDLEKYAKTIDDFESLKGRIADIATTLMASPEENVALFKELRSLAQLVRGKSSALVILTESQLFKDICPAYKIRGITEKEAEIKVSKEVKNLRKFEQTLATSYRSFVMSCISLSRWTSGGAEETSLTRDMWHVRLAACKALAGLIRSLPHFNEAFLIADRVCILVADRESEIRRVCADALKSVLSDAHRGSGPTLETCLLVAKKLASVAVGKVNVVPAEVVEPLAEIQFASFSMLPIGKRKREKAKRFNKKYRKKQVKEGKSVEETELERDLREADAEAGPSELYNARKSLLKSVCDAYFNIIKASSSAVEKGTGASKSGAAGKARKPPPALSPALKGLLRVSSFISTEIIEAILGALTPLLETDRLPLTVRFRCLAAAYAVLGEHSRIQQADPDSFTGDTRAMDRSMYTAIGCLYGDESRSKDQEYITFDAIEALISCFSFREVPLVRCSAIARRLSVMAGALAPTHACSIGLLRVAQVMLPPSLVSPIYPQRGDKPGDTELNSDLGHIQAYDFDTNDPEVAGAERSVAWELSALTSHFHPTVREIAVSCASGYCGSRLPQSSENILQVTKGYSTAKGGFNPSPMDKPKGGVTKKLKRKRRNISDDNVLASIFMKPEDRLTFLNSDSEGPSEFFETIWKDDAPERMVGEA